HALGPDDLHIRQLTVRFQAQHRLHSPEVEVALHCTVALQEGGVFHHGRGVAPHLGGEIVADRCLRAVSGAEREVGVGGAGAQHRQDEDEHEADCERGPSATTATGRRWLKDGGISGRWRVRGNRRCVYRLNGGTGSDRWWRRRWGRGPGRDSIHVLTVAGHPWTRHVFPAHRLPLSNHIPERGVLHVPFWVNGCRL